METQEEFGDCNACDVADVDLDCFSEILCSRLPALRNWKSSSLVGRKVGDCNGEGTVLRTREYRVSWPWTGGSSSSPKKMTSDGVSSHG